MRSTVGWEQLLSSYTGGGDEDVDKQEGGSQVYEAFWHDGRDLVDLRLGGLEKKRCFILKLLL